MFGFGLFFTNWDMNIENLPIELEALYLFNLYQLVYFSELRSCFSHELSRGQLSEEVLILFVDAKKCWLCGIQELGNINGTESVK